MAFTSETGEFKGSKTFSVMDGDRRVITFGVNKAKAILSVLKDLEQFVANNDNTTTNQSVTLDVSGLSKEQLSYISQFIKR